MKNFIFIFVGFLIGMFFVSPVFAQVKGKIFPNLNAVVADFSFEDESLFLREKLSDQINITLQWIEKFKAQKNCQK